MISTFSQLAAEVARAAGEPAIVARMIDRIRNLPREEQRVLLRTAMLEHRELGVLGEEWEPRRTLVGVILHAVGVRTLENDEQRAIRTAIQADLSKLNGDSEAYRSLDWIRSEDLLKRFQLPGDACASE